MIRKLVQHFTRHTVTLCVDTLENGRLAQKLGEDSQVPRPESDAFHLYVAASTCSRSLFILNDESWMGLAPMDSKAGDLIALLEGGGVPYILRPKYEMGETLFEIIGDAYVHGIMDGEAWNSAAVQDIILV
ncbi:hypothetical protein HYALB_00004586 [Hymenoscyphus albidus]|uniref:Uncharacterized protein n=1 Tax=Hymenoscyphus albidus TaxID=595503 RepID=A0A9N9Q275_9HELO|nr:hypothetical protein HYALB_00004586 [Hymenoscyphus albidus]